MSEEKEILLGYLIGSVSILRDMNIQFTEKSRNKLADKIIEQIKEDKFYKRKAEQLQWKLDAYERLSDCNEEFEL